MVMRPGVLALVPANYPEPSYITENSEVITVDGDYSDWDLNNDYFADMYNAGNPSEDDFSGYVEFSKLYLRYDCESETLYALVLRENGHVFKDSPSDMWIKEYSLPPSSKIIGMDIGDPGNICYIYSGSEIIGYEASGSLASGEYNQFKAHAQISTGQTSSTGKHNTISLKIVCNNNEIPEFPIVALPIMTILGIMFILQSRKRKED